MSKADKKAIEQLQPSIITKISQSILANQIAYNFLHEIQFTQYNKHRLKMLLKQVNEELAKAEKTEYDLLYDKKESATRETYSAMEEMVKEISELGLFHFDNIKEIIRAYKKNPASDMGIAKKLNR